MRKTVQIASLLVGAALLGGVAMPTWAVDGVILIDQNKAMAGNVTPGDAPGFPVTISLPGSYRLASNLIVPDEVTTAIVVTASNVTIDLNGFSIVGPNSCTVGGFPQFRVTCTFNSTGIGIDARSVFVRNLTVENGTIIGMGQSGVLAEGLGTRISSVTATQNGSHGIVIGLGVVDRCMLIFNGGAGVVANSDSGLIQNSYFHLNASFGIAASRAWGFLGNVFTSNNNPSSTQTLEPTNMGHNLCGGTFCP